MTDTTSRRTLRQVIATDNAVLGISLTLALTLGSAVYSAAAGLPDTSPADVLPGTAIAYVAVDLDPAGSQASAIAALASAATGKPQTFGEARDFVLDGMLSDDSISYATEIKPWLGGQVAVALLKSGPIVAIETDQVEQAKTAIRRADDEVGFAEMSGYLVLGPDQSAVDAAMKATASESLEDRSDFSSDLDRLTGPQVVTGWVDVGTAIPELLKMLNGIGGAATIAPFGLLGQDFTSLEGHVVMGLHATPRYAELTAITTGGPAGKAMAVSPEILTDLPESTVAAILLPGLNDLVQTITGVAGPLLAGGLLGGGGEATGPLAILPALFGTVSQLAPLLDGATVVALGNTPFGGGTPVIGLGSEVSDPTKAEGLLRLLAKQLTDAGVTTQVAVSGSRLYAATGQTYANDLAAKPGTLGHSERFQLAVGDLGSRVASALYVDLTRFRDVIDLGGISALGMTGSADQVQLRLVIG